LKSSETIRFLLGLKKPVSALKVSATSVKDR
jgi:hypothetical protein